NARTTISIVFWSKIQLLSPNSKAAFSEDSANNPSPPARLRGARAHVSPPPAPTRSLRMSTQPGPDFGQSTDSPHLRVLSQYVKELSFRNVMAAASAQAYENQPTIDMGVEVKSRPVGDQREAVEVDLCVSVSAKRADTLMFSVNLVYSGLFQF